MNEDVNAPDLHIEIVITGLVPRVRLLELILVVLIGEANLSGDGHGPNMIVRTRNQTEDHIVTVMIHRRIAPENQDLFHVSVIYSANLLVVETMLQRNLHGTMMNQSELKR
jgi:hypothetical protein